MVRGSSSEELKRAVACTAKISDWREWRGAGALAPWPTAASRVFSSSLASLNSPPSACNHSA